MSGPSDKGESLKLTKMAPSKRPEYFPWSSMVSRCTKPNYSGYGKYGGAGIGVASEWIGAEGYQLFVDHIGPRPSPLHQIDRIDGLRGYEPGNVRWATPTEQNRNRRDNVRIAFGGETLCMSEWAGRFGISRQSMQKRVRLWGAEKALSTPRRSYLDAGRQALATNTTREG